MKVLYRHFLPSREHPAALMVHHLASALRQQGFDVLVQGNEGLEEPPTQARAEFDDLTFPDETSSNGLEAFSTSPGRSPLQFLKDKVWFLKALARQWPAARADRRMLDHVKPDVVLVRQDPYCVSMVREAHRRGLPIVTFADAPLAHELKYFGDGKRWHPLAVVRALEHYGLARSRAVVTVSEPARMVLQRYRLSIPIQIATNGVDEPLFSSLSLNGRQRIRQRLNIEPASCVVAYLGTFKSFHGTDQLVDLINHTAGHDNVHWLILGDGPQRSACQNRCEKHSRVHWLGRVPHPQVPWWLRSADVAVAPYPPSPQSTLFHFCPLKVLESAAAGCAVLASDRGDISRLLDHGRAGVVVSSDDSQSWHQALDDCITRPDWRAQLGQKARQHVLSNFTWARSAEKIAQVLRQVTPTPSAPEMTAVVSSTHAVENQQR